MSVSKSLVRPFKSIADGDMANNIIGKATSLERVDNVMFFIEWTGTAPVGILNIQFLKIEQATDGSPSDIWSNLSFGGLTGTDISITGNSGSHTIVLTQTPFSKVKPVYTATSGSGTLNITIVAKEG
jgi:hypothetical protein